MKIKGNLKVDNGQINSGVNQTLHSGATNSAIVGGANNTVNSNYSLIGGGRFNLITGGTYGGNTIAGGGYSSYENKIIDSSFSFIGAGYNNTIEDAAEKVSIIGGAFNTISGGTNNIIGGGSQNTIINVNHSSVFCGYSNTITHNHAHVIGANITSVSANTTHVEKLNIGTLNGTTSVVGLGLDANNMVVSAATGGGTAKFVQTNGYTADTTVTITHSLGVDDECVVSLRNTSTNEEINGVIDNFTTNTLDVTLSETLASVKVVIIG